MKKGIRILSLALGFALILSYLSAPAFAAKKEKKPEVFPPAGNLSFEDAITRELNVTIDGEAPATAAARMIQASPGTRSWRRMPGRSSPCRCA